MLTFYIGVNIRFLLVLCAVILFSEDGLSHVDIVVQRVNSQSAAIIVAARDLN
jgi:hypothetical protein